MRITREWIKSLNGFVQEMPGTYTRTLSRGPEDSLVSISVGATPWNGHGVMVYIGGFGVLTSAESQEDVLTLLRLLVNGRIDNPDCE